jgi:protein SCO1/2
MAVKHGTLAVPGRTEAARENPRDRRMRIDRQSAARAALAAAVVLSGCSRPAATGPRPPDSTGARKVIDYPLVGVVRQVDAKARLVTIRHEEIPGFMAAMTMPFEVKDPKDLEDVRPGDEVEGTLRVVKTGGEVSGFETTRRVSS